MFFDVITNGLTDFLGTAADKLFPKIKCIEAFPGGDQSFLATARAIYPDRIGDDELNIAFHELECGELDSSGSGYDHFVSPNTLRIVSITGSPEKVGTELEQIKKYFEKTDGFCLNEHVSGFFAGSFKCLCVTNESKKASVLFVENADIRTIHVLQSAILVFLPWYFDKSVPIKDQEMKLFKSFGKDTSDEYLSCLSVFAEKYDFAEMRIRAELDGFEVRYHEQQINNMKRGVESKERELVAINSEFSRKLREKNELLIRLNGMIAAKESAKTNDLMEYFLSNRAVLLDRVDGSVLTFTALSDLVFFEESEAEAAIMNYDSVLYEYNDCYDNEDMKRFLEAVFIDRDLKIRFCAQYTLDILGGIEAVSDAEFCKKCETYMPNPHIDQYSCMGDHKRAINELVMSGNFIQAIEQCIASCGSLNFADGTVLEEFAAQIANGSRHQKNTRCVELPNGDIVDIGEAIQYLKTA